MGSRLTIRSLYGCFSLVAVFSAAIVMAADWPQFLGPHRTGISDEKGLLESWPKAGPKEVWRVPGGVGMSGMAISRGRLITLVQKEGKQWTVALDAKSGKTIWEAEIAPEYENPMGNGPRGTPAIVGETVLVFTGEGVLAALGFADGKVQWSKNVVEELGGKPAEYGMACSPLVVGKQVIVTAGAPSATVCAFDISSGKLAWSSGEDSTGYSSPALRKVAGQEQIVVHSGSAVLGLAPASGAVLWRYPYETEFDCNIATPLAIDGDIFVSSGENHGSVLLKLTPSGKTFEPQSVWESQGVGSVLRTEWQTAIFLDGYLYGFDNVGSAGPVTHLTCIEAKSGKRMWQQLRFGKGNLIAADGKLLISTMKGEFVMVRANPKKYDEIGRAEVIGTTRQAPALSGGLVYLRDDNEIICLAVRK